MPCKLHAYSDGVKRVKHKFEDVHQQGRYALDCRTAPHLFDLIYDRSDKDDAAANPIHPPSIEDGFVE